MKMRQNKASLNPFSATSIVIVMICMGIFMLNFTSATTWDNFAYYALDETSGDVIDETGNYDGTNYGATRGVAGRINNAFDFDGDDDMVERQAIPFSGDTATLSVWVKRDDINNDDGILSFNNNVSGSNTYIEYVIMDDGTLMQGSPAGGLSTSWRTTTSPLDNTDWHHIVIVIDNEYIVYVDGVEMDLSFTSGDNDGDFVNDLSAYNRFGIGMMRRDDETYNPFDGKIDEVGIWDRALTQTEIIELYNGGDGLSYYEEGNFISINLLSPTDGSTQTEDVEFNATITPTYVNITNATLYIWDDDGLFDTDTKTYTNQNSSVTENWTISGFEAGDYDWNVYGCYENETSGEHLNCTWAGSNYTFTWQPFEVTDAQYSNEVYETDEETYNLTIETLETVLQVSAELNYNGSTEVSSVSCSGGVCDITNTIDVPFVDVSEQNRSFYWIVNIFDGDSETNYNTSLYYQNTTQISLHKCGGGETTLNFKAYNETHLSRINPFDFKATFEYWMGRGSVYRNLSLNEEDVSDVDICLTPGEIELYTDATIDYGFGDENITYVNRNYYFDNAQLTNTTQNIELYLLNAEEATTFIQEVEDQQTEAVPGALVYIQRYYPKDGEYRTVQISKTDDNGKSVGFYKVETINYRHLILLDGEVVLQTEKGKVFGESVPYTLIFKIGDALNYPWQVLESDSNIITSLTFNESTNITTYSWIDSTGATNRGQLLVYQINYDGDNILICNKSAEFSSGTLTCDTTGYDGSFEAYGYVYPNTLTDIINFVVSTAKDIFGNTGMIMGWLIILTATLIFIWNPTAMIVAHNAATIFVNLIGFISFGPIYIFSMIAVSIIIIIFMRT